MLVLAQNRRAPARPGAVDRGRLAASETAESCFVAILNLIGTQDSSACIQRVRWRHGV